MTTLASTLAYGYVHFVSEGSFRPTEVRGWVAVFIFLPIALLANVVAGAGPIAHRRGRPTPPRGRGKS